MSVSIQWRAVRSDSPTSVFNRPVDQMTLHRSKDAQRYHLYYKVNARNRRQWDRAQRITNVKAYAIGFCRWSPAAATPANRLSATTTPAATAAATTVSIYPLQFVRLKISSELPAKSSVLICLFVFVFSLRKQWDVAAKEHRHASPSTASATATTSDTCSTRHRIACDAESIDSAVKCVDNIASNSCLGRNGRRQYCTQHTK